MSTALAERTTVTSFATAERLGTFTRRDDGTATLGEFPVFRAGTFSDSEGIVHTWTDEHLRQMVFHFELLRDQGILVNVPVRTDHGRSINDVIGYFADLSVADGKLLATIEFTEPEAADKWERGTYRSRSLEVGFYATNDDAGYWPVVLGVAFVDIPAVEGLFNKGSDSNISNEENEMTDVTMSQEDLDHLIAANYAQGLEDAAANHTKDFAPHVFSIGGSAEPNYAAVQAHIDTLEADAQTAVAEARSKFVNELASSNRIAATQVESMTKLAQGLDDEQYAAFTASFDAAPAKELFDKHGDPITKPDAENDDGDAESALETAKEIVRMHRRSGMSTEQIEATSSYKMLVAAGVNS